MSIVGGRSARMPAYASMGSAIRERASARVSRTGGGHSVPAPATAATTPSVTNRRGPASANQAGGAAAATTSVLATTHLVSSSLGAASAGAGPLGPAVTATASATWGSAIKWMEHVPVTRDTGASFAESHVQLASMAKVVGDGKKSLCFPKPPKIWKKYSCCLRPTVAPLLGSLEPCSDIGKCRLKQAWAEEHVEAWY